MGSFSADRREAYLLGAQDSHDKAGWRRSGGRGQPEGIVKQVDFPALSMDQFPPKHRILIGVSLRGPDLYVQLTRHGLSCSSQ